MWAHLALHDAVRDAHLAAEGGQPHHQLNGVHVVGDDDERRLLLLDERSHVLESELDNLSTPAHNTKIYQWQTWISHLSSLALDTPKAAKLFRPFFPAVKPEHTRQGGTIQNCISVLRKDTIEYSTRLLSC